MGLSTSITRMHMHRQSSDAAAYAALNPKPHTLLCAEGMEYQNLVRLCLDRPTLQKMGVASHIINRVHRALQANATAFSK
jgi:hypothetical protein